jgi:hypothetical protein
MDRVEAPEDLVRIVRWFRERDWMLWDVEIDAGSALGKMDFLFEEAASSSQSDHNGERGRHAA